MTKGAADCTAAEALAPASGSTFVGPVAAWAKMPLTKEASPEERVVSTSALVRGLRAARSICGTRRGLSESLCGVNGRSNHERSDVDLLGHRRAHEVSVDLADVHEHLELGQGVTSRFEKLPGIFCTVAPRYDRLMLISAAVTPTQGSIGAETLYMRSSAWKTPVVLSRNGRL
jgi:hypothetical protein